MNCIHTLEVPFYVEPSQQFERFIKRLNRSQGSSLFFVKYWKGKITFTLDSRDNEYTISICPFPINFDELRKIDIEKSISAFCSKLNCANAFLGKDCDLYVKLAKPDDEHVDIYGKDIKFLIIVTIICRSTAVEMAIDNFFTVVDMSD